MAVISPSPLSQAIQATLRETISKKAGSGNISLVDELIGYTIAGDLTSRFYAPQQPDVSSPNRVVAAPEILTGLVKSKWA